MNDNDAGLNNLLKWGIEHSETSRNDQSTNPPRDASSGLSADALAQLLGGPSDADRMRDAMTTITAHESKASKEDKLTAWDNFEQLIESIDNANNMEPLGLWTPLIDQLGSPEAEYRVMACWCVGTAVQNNVKAQEREHAAGITTKIAKMASGDPDKAVRKKAIFALSSSVRNYQPNLDAALNALPAKDRPEGKVSAEDMEAIDAIMQRLRDQL